MLYAYPACFYKEENGEYSVIFPDLNHLSICGKTLDKAFEMSIDCLAGYLYSCKKSGEDIVQPSEINNININDEYDGYIDAFKTMIIVDIEEYAKTHFEKSVKKTLTIPKWLNDMATEKKINFSQLLQNALMDELQLNND